MTASSTLLVSALPLVFAIDGTSCCTDNQLWRVAARIKSGKKETALPPPSSPPQGHWPHHPHRGRHHSVLQKHHPFILHTTQTGRWCFYFFFVLFYFFLTEEDPLQTLQAMNLLHGYKNKLKQYWTTIRIDPVSFKNTTNNQAMEFPFPHHSSKYLLINCNFRRNLRPQPCILHWCNLLLGVPIHMHVQHQPAERCSQIIGQVFIRHAAEDEIHVQLARNLIYG